MNIHETLLVGLGIGNLGPSYKPFSVCRSKALSFLTAP